MIVQHNLQAMNASRMLGITTGQMGKSTEKLSSGYKINRAADNAAGLAISEKMRKQIRGLTQASINAEDGISCVQTAEGALAEVQDMLQRMNELCVQAANGTNSQTDRRYIQDELDQLINEIDRVAETTKFNETYLLKGDETKAKSSVYITDYSVTYTRNQLPNDIKMGVKYMTNYIGTNNIYVVSASIYNTEANMSLTGHKISMGDDITEYLEETDDAKKDPNWTPISNVDSRATLNTTSYVAFINVELNSDVQTGAGGRVASLDENNNYKPNDYDLSTDGTSSIVNANRDLFIYNTANDTVTRLPVGSPMTEYLKKDGTNTMKDEYRLVDILYGDMGQLKNTGKAVKGEGTVAHASAKVASSILTDGKDFDWRNNLKLAESKQKLYNANGVEVSGVGLNKYFDEDGNYMGGLFTTPQARAIDEVFAKSTSINKAFSSIADKGVADIIPNGAATIDKFITQSSTEILAALDVNLHTGADSDRANKINVEMSTLTAAGLGIDKLASWNIGIVDNTGENATDAIDVVAEALNKVSRQRSALGAVQNRLEHTIKNLDNIVENTTAAEAQIRDTDMADEMVRYSNNNILQQAGQSMLAQANQSNQGVLSLLQ